MDSKLIYFIILQSFNMRDSEIKLAPTIKTKMTAWTSIWNFFVLKWRPIIIATSMRKPHIPTYIKKWIMYNWPIYAIKLPKESSSLLLLIDLGSSLNRNLLINYIFQFLKFQIVIIHWIRLSDKDWYIIPESI